jgi:hypothetical protein
MWRVQVLAAIVDGAVVDAAQQHQVAQIGGAAVQPVPHMMGLAPSRRPVTAGEAAATVPDRQRGPLRGGDHPGGAAHLQGLGRGWVGAPPRAGGSRAIAARSWAASSLPLRASLSCWAG